VPSVLQDAVNPVWVADFVAQQASSFGDGPWYPCCDALHWVGIGPEYIFAAQDRLHASREIEPCGDLCRWYSPLDRQNLESTRLALLSALQQERRQLESRLRAELDSLNPVAVKARVKPAQSVYVKLQRGETADLFDLDDLVAARAVFLHSSQVQEALEITRVVFKDRIAEERNIEVGKPTDFRYQQPHIIARLPREYVDRHHDLAALKFEVQYTTYIQHALQESTHDVIY
jgi:hypothetical protein